MVVPSFPLQRYDSRYSLFSMVKGNSIPKTPLLVENNDRPHSYQVPIDIITGDCEFLNLTAPTTSFSRPEADLA